MSNFQTLARRPTDGGQLTYRITDSGLANYARKVNLRRDLDQEICREGDALFRNGPGGNLKQVFYATAADGTEVIFVANDTTIWRFSENWDYQYYADWPNGVEYVEGWDASTPYIGSDTSGTWYQIASGLSPGNRWEMVQPNNAYVVFNNGEELPLFYHLNSLEAEPIHELRELGVAAVGTIWAHAGSLLCANIRYILDSYLPTVLNGVDPYGPFDLNGYARYEPHDFIISSTGLPRFGSSVTGTITEGSRSLTLNYPMASFQTGDEIRISGAGVNGSNLDAVIVSMSGASVTIDRDASTSVTSNIVFRSDVPELSPQPTRYDLAFQGGQIQRVWTLGDYIACLMDRGMAVGLPRGSSDDPINWIYLDVGNSGIKWPWTLANLENTTSAIYAGRDGFYTISETRLQPQRVPELELCADLFFDAATEANRQRIHAIRSITNEVFFCVPGAQETKVLAFDIETRTASQIDKFFEAGCFGVFDGIEYLFLAEGSNVLVYGFSHENSPFLGNSKRLYTRNGIGFSFSLEGGMENLGAPRVEKVWDSYAIEMAEGSGAVPPVTLQLSTYQTPADTSPNNALSTSNHTFAALDSGGVKVGLSTGKAIAMRDKLTGLCGPNFKLVRRAYEYRPIATADVPGRNAD